MSELKNGGPAFPRAGVANPDPLRGPAWADDPQDGMTLLDWFAGQALGSIKNDEVLAENAAKWSYETAEAMLAERQRRSAK